MEKRCKKKIKKEYKKPVLQKITFDQVVKAVCNPDIGQPLPGCASVVI